MRKKRIIWSDQDMDYHDVDKFFEFHDLSLRQYYTDLVEAIFKNKSIEGRILDLGCGLGILGMRICSQNEYSTVVGLESSRTLVKTAEVMTSRRGYTDRISIKYWPDDNFPFADGEFDAVVGFLSLHKWNNPERVLAEIERVRKKESIVYISDFRRDQPSIQFSLFVQQARFEMGKEIAESLKKTAKSTYTAEEIRQHLINLNLTHYRLEETKQFINIISGLPLESETTPAKVETETNKA